MRRLEKEIKKKGVKDQESLSMLLNKQKNPRIIKINKRNLKVDKFNISTTDTKKGKEVTIDTPSSPGNSVSEFQR